MKIFFVDGVEVTVTRALIDKSLFDVWLPSCQPGFAASVTLDVKHEAVMSKLNKLASEAAAIT